MLQVTDELVNGAGFCRNLSEPERGVPRVLRLLHSMLTDPDAYPMSVLNDFGHAGCDAACYRCLLRYGNQHDHGLLDWRLGLTYLRAMVDSSFRCGLDGNFEYPGLSGWLETADSGC